jgi:hypothetical protein
LIFSIETISGYSRFICWLIRDSLWRNKGIPLLIVISGALGVAFQVKVFGLMMYYAKHLSSGEAIRLWGYEVDPQHSLGLLAMASVAVFFLLALSPLSIYFSTRNGQTGDLEWAGAEA